jgi:predicted phosphodiesterase
VTAEALPPERGRTGQAAYERCPDCGGRKIVGRPCADCALRKMGVDERFAARRAAIGLRTTIVALVALVALSAFEILLYRRLPRLDWAHLVALALVLAVVAFLSWKLVRLNRKAAAPIPRFRVFGEARESDSEGVPAPASVVPEPPGRTGTAGSWLLLSDTHGSMRSLGAIADCRSQGRLDGVFLAGDFSNFGEHSEPLFERIRDLGIPCAFVSGNHESEALCADLAARFGFIWLDYRAERLGPLWIAGVGGCDMFSAKREGRIAGFAASLPPPPPGTVKVLLSHQPPSPWLRGGQDLGSAAVGRLLRDGRFDLAVVGHCHQSAPGAADGPRGISVLNPGPTGQVLCLDEATTGPGPGGKR